MSAVAALSFGGGVNSTAMLLRLVRDGNPPSIVLFADTGGEKPETYEHIQELRVWCSQRSIPFVTVTNGGRGQGETLEENCLTRKELPSLAYGFKGCSVKWKRQPMDRYLKLWPPAVEVWARGGKIVRYIGIDAGEPHRAKLEPDALYIYRYPLVEWGLGRKECVEEIRAAGMRVPPKSSCFFCPAMRRHEILDLHKRHPDLSARAVAMERNAETRTIVGLGRTWKWEHLVNQDAKQGKLWPELGELPCGCHDEGEE